MASLTFKPVSNQEPHDAEPASLAHGSKAILHPRLGSRQLTGSATRLWYRGPSLATRGALLFTLAIAASACGTPSGGQGKTPAKLGTELGADRVTWMAHHKSGDPTFRDLSFAGDRVDGFTMHLGAGGLGEDAARATAAKEIPPDARLIFESPKYFGSADVDDQCDLLQYQSAELGRVIPHDPSGVIIVQLGRLTGNGLEAYDRNHVTTISILATGTLNYVPSEC